MNIVLENGLREFIASKNYLEKYNSNVYTHVCVIIKDGMVLIKTNTGLDKNGVDVINNFINKSKFENIILSVRTSKEPFSDNYPSDTLLRQLLNNRNNKNIVLFNQEPWPEPVPNFSNSNLVIRFGFDEECKFDKLQLAEPLPLSEFGIMVGVGSSLIPSLIPKDGTYQYLLNNQEHSADNKKINII